VPNEYRKQRMGLLLEHLQRYEAAGDAYLRWIVMGDETFKPR
jgi:hypothetical protein